MSADGVSSERSPARSVPKNSKYRRNENLSSLMMEVPPSPNPGTSFHPPHLKKSFPHVTSSFIVSVSSEESTTSDGSS